MDHATRQRRMNAAQRRYDAMSPPPAGCDCCQADCPECSPGVACCDLCDQPAALHRADDGYGESVNVCDACDPTRVLQGAA